ncbi:ABC-2 type transport system ATP-binding protein [Comamonas sp. BIGb0152]|uniref:ABC transporter ATP-binding protein n=1 Tax=Comamonas sp. BIGb0152 TaxID=2940601 RepID=UPI0021683460|nr:ABC transporter ATP-binding protein [Comamonas sp. BIGb0152]MCS4292561.1 ABC-2 type transport system ATP-binding protein [Comamonas sp. BIGb0152]
MSNNLILEARDLTIQRDSRTTLKNLNLGIASGTVYALLGGNGAGKTTTLNAFLGFVKAFSGQALVDGINASVHSQDARSRLAYLPENVALYPYLSGVENLRYFCMISKLPLTKDGAHELLMSSGLAADAHDRKVAGYSKGMRQKVGLAIATARHAHAMLLDEPTSGLDPAAANEFAQSVLVAKHAGMAILMATHDLHNVLQVADRIGILREGQLVSEFDAKRVDHYMLERIYLEHAGARRMEVAVS